MHWVQDCYRAGDTPSHEDFDIAILFEALSRAQIRVRYRSGGYDAKAADPDAKKFRQLFTTSQSERYHSTNFSIPCRECLLYLRRRMRPLTERAKVDELLTKVQNSGLTAAIAQLRYQLNTTGVTFTVAANHLNSEVSQTPDYQLSRKINAVNTSTGGMAVDLDVAEAAVVVAAVVLAVVVEVAVPARVKITRQHTTPRRSGEIVVGCDVTPYNADIYAPERNVPIISGATAWTSHESGQTYILVVNEGLWFGDKLQNTLLNPNQLRYSGVNVADNPFNTAEPISITHEDLTIPLSISGTIIFLETATPTQSELDHCPHIHLTCDSDWNPQTVRLASTHSVEAEVIADVEPGLAQISSVYCSQALAEMMNQQRYLGSTQVDIPAARTFISSNRHPQVTSENLSERWNIGLQQAKQTLQVTTQKGVRSAIMPLSRRYRTDLMYQQRKLRNQKFYTDTLFGKYKSLTNNTCIQIFANESQFVKAYPMETKAMAGSALRQFVRDYGVPERLTSDGAAEQTGPKTEFMKIVRKYDIDHHLSEPYRPNQNRAESVIREVKRRWFKHMVKRRVPKRLWDYGIYMGCETMSLTANSTFR
ncbi:Reverse transcriptase (RNA-dependent DNA polymerase) [Fragilaria crotonensis]|nr:Reverse transcriptase (RNA-dependent DNA polymerase) [Fragilaria crotonensis]